MNGSRRRTVKHLLAVFVFSAVWAGAAHQPAAAGRSKQVVLCVDMVSAVPFAHPAASVFVGNPAIADVVTKKGNVVLLQGRSVGNTNILALDEAGKTVAKWRVVVRETLTGRVTLMRAATRHTLSCAPNCEPVPVAGDEETGFKSLSAQIKTRIDTALEAGRSTQ